jgi:hypothetical protein
MASKITAEFDSYRLSAALTELSKISGRDFRDVVENEATRVLEKASKNTVKASRESIEKTRDPELKKLRIAAIGLAKRAFWELANALNIQTFGVPAYVGKARSKTASDSDTSGERQGNGPRFTLIGRIPAHRSYPGAEMFKAINDALYTRARYFEISAARKWLETAKGLEQRYPWMKAK